MELVRYSSPSAAAARGGGPAVEEIYADFTRMNIDSTDDRPLNVDMAMRFLPNVSIAAISTSPYRTERTRAQTVDGNDDFVLTLSTRSGISVSQPGRELEFGAGEAGLWQSDKVMTAVASKDARLFNVSVPRNTVLSSVGDIDAVLGERVPASVPLRLLAGYAEGLISDARLSPDMAVLAESHMLDLVAAALGPRPGAGEEPGGIRAARLAAIKRDILKHLTDPALSLDWLAGRHGISRRYLRGLFYADRTSFSDYLREARLARARELLSSPRFAHLSISTIAYEAGFGDLSGFNRAFRRRFSMTPSETRERAATRRKR